VEIDGDAYWDGLFSDNPPVEELIRPRSVGTENIPEEIWLIKINPTARKRVPLESGDILDRRNQLEGNISLFHQLDHIEMINDLILAGAFNPEFLGLLGLKTAIRIPKSFDTDPDKPYHIPCIEMPVEVQEKLDYEGKIDRSAKNIDFLIAQGEAAAKEFLTRRAAAVAAKPLPGPGEGPKFAEVMAAVQKAYKPGGAARER
jgi:NTE family protein